MAIPGSPKTDQCVESQKFHCMTTGTTTLPLVVTSIPNPTPTLSLMVFTKPSAMWNVPRKPSPGATYGKKGSPKPRTPCGSASNM